MSLHNPGGKCKWFEVAGQKVQGSWERDIALKFEQLKINWNKLKVNSDILKYIINNIEKSYTPDFYLKEYNLYIEIKGFWWGNDKEKMDAVMDQHPDKKILIIEKKLYKSIINDTIDFKCLCSSLVERNIEDVGVNGSIPF